MSDDEYTEPSLFLAYNSDSSQIPTDLQYTSFLILRPKGMFADFLKEEEYVIACGTFEGAILIVGENPTDKDNNNPSLQRISLLCGHEHPICSMIQTLQDTNFLSISTDGTLCCWSLFDFTCIFKKKVFYEKGDYKFILSWSFQNKVWILSTGLFFCLFDLRLKSVIKKVKMSGILSLCVLSPNKLNYIKDFIAVVLSIDKITVFKIQISNFLFFPLYESTFSKIQPELHFFLNEYGIVRVNKSTNKWSIINSGTFKEVLIGQLELQENDQVSDVEWKSLETIVFSTFKGDFFIYQIHLDEFKNSKNKIKFKYVIKSTQKVHTNFFCNKFIFNETLNISEKVCIAFSPDSRKIVLLRQDDRSENGYLKLILKPIQKKKKLSFPIESHHPIILLTKNDKTVILTNSQTGREIDRFTFGQKVTSIYFGNDKKSGEMIVIAGHSNGSLTYFKQTSRRTVVINALCDEIIGILHLPIKKDKHNVILVVSHNSACLIQKEKVVSIFPVDQYRLISIYLIETYLLFEHINGLIETFSLNATNDPLFMSVIPKKARCIWKFFNNNSTVQSYSNYSSSASLLSADDSAGLPIDPISSSIILKRIGRSSFCYHFYDISLMISNFNADQITVMLEYVKLICNLKLNDNCSYVLIGSNNTSQTFFYHGYSAHGSNIIKASDQITASHFLINIMMKIVFKIQLDNAPNLGKDYVRCLPLFVKYLTLTENKMIQKFLLSVCFDLSSYMTFIQCQNLNERLTIDNEKFIDESTTTFLSLSFVATKHPECVKPDLIVQLLHFLLKLSEEESIEAEMALFLLIDGKSNVWLNYFIESSQNKASQFYIKIITSFCKCSKTTFLSNKLCNDVYSDMKNYSDTLIEIANNDVTCDMKKVVNMFWLVVTTKSSGSLDSQNESDPLDIWVALANFWSNSKTADYVDTIMCQDSNFRNVMHQNNVTVIGKNNGELFAFSKGKKWASDRPFEGKISFVSVSPSAGFCVAICESEKKSCLYQIKINSFIKKLSLILVEKGEIENNVTAVNWSSEEKWSPA